MLNSSLPVSAVVSLHRLQFQHFSIYNRANVETKRYRLVFGRFSVLISSGTPVLFSYNAFVSRKDVPFHERFSSHRSNGEGTKQPMQK
jgi:hypothetical protein